MSLTNIELMILNDIYKVDFEGGIIDFNNYLKETENNKRTKELANHLMRLRKLGYVSLDGVFVVGGREDEVYHNNVSIIYPEKIKITGKGIEYIREAEAQNSKKIIQLDNIYASDDTNIWAEGNIQGSTDLSSSVTITNKATTAKLNRLGIADWINIINPLLINDSVKYASNIIKDRLLNKFDVQWSVGNRKKNSVHLYASNDYATVYAYLKVEEGRLKSQGPRGIKNENGKVKVHKCMQETKLFTTLNEKNAYQFTEILLKALESPNDIIGISIRNEGIDGNSDISTIDEEGTDYKPTVTTFSSDISDGPDLLKITEDVEAISNLITLRALNTPLSIGLFGNWGSGKSFFMKKMQDKIENTERIIEYLNNKDQLNEKDSKYKEMFCEGIVQIRFNAWHYIDANLWASLVSHILTEISNKINNVDSNNIIDEIRLPFIEEFESAKELKTQLEKERDIYTKIKNENHNRIKELENQIKQTKIDKSNINITEVVKKLIIEENVKSKISEIFPDLKDLPESLKNLLEAKSNFDDILKDTQGTIRKIIKTFSLLSNKDKWVISTILTILLLLYIALNSLPIDITTFLGQVIKGAIGIISTTSFIFGLTNIKPFKDFKVKVNRWCDYLIDLAEKQSNVLEKQKDELYNQLIQISIEKEKTEKEITKIGADIAYIESEINEIKEGKYIKYFIEKRLSSNDYRKHLGIINLIRKDFEVLSNHLEKGIKSERHEINRIILYIDDLDRCPPKVVVDVLQAIHLILSFKLFVVVVGVDVRWISKCLSENYKLMFNDNNNDEGASSYDYLEKIFQIPVKLEQISPDKSKQYINSLLRENLAIQINENNSVINNIETEQVGDVLEQDTEQMDYDISEDLYDEIETMKLTKEDIEDLDEFTSILGNTPRTIKRFVNIYRLIKASDIHPKNNRNVIFMISVITGLPYISMNLFSEIQKTNSSSIKELIKQFDLKGENRKVDKLKEIELCKLKKFLLDPNFKDIPVIELKHLVSKIGRYSFHLDDLAFES